MKSISWSRSQCLLSAAILAGTALVLFSNGAMASSFRLLAAYGGETVTVTTLEDVSDASGLKQVSDLPGPDGRVSFREAVTAANNTTGPQTIAFAIPTSEFWLVQDMALLKLEEDAFFLNDSGTTVDFSTQTVNIGNTNPNGPEVGIYGLQANGWGIAAIFLNGDNCTVKGLGKVYQRGYAVRMVGNNNRLIASKIDGPLHAAVAIEGYMGWPPPTGNVIGGTAPGEGNSLIGLVIDGPAEGNIVIGNTLLVGVQVRGATQYGVFARNNRIGGPTPAERNLIAGAGSFGEEGFPSGAQISIIDADGTIVEGNYIGTTADGMNRYPQQIGPVGVEIYDSRNTSVRGNLIAGLRTVGTDHYAGVVFGQAVHVGAINANTRDTVIEGNTIGLAVDGVTPIMTRSGVSVSPFSSFYHAFNTLITSNHIAKVEATGVFVADLENGATITRNFIHECGALGIDLGTAAGVDGVTPNDSGDGDTGGNGLQNFPVLVAAATTGSAVTVQGILDSSPNAQFTVEFFASTSGSASGFGDGAVFLGSTSVTTNGAGHAAFSVTLQAVAAVGAVATATATRVSTGDTSEFSAWIAMTSAGLRVIPEEFNIAWGALQAGSLGSLANSDDLRLSINGSVTGTRTSPNVQVEISGTSPLSQPALLSFELEAQSDLSPSGQVPQRLELFNFVTGQWVQVDQRFATIADSVTLFTISSNAAQFVQPGTKRMRARLTWFGGTQFSRTQGSKIDKCNWWVR